MNSRSQSPSALDYGIAALLTAVVFLVYHATLTPSLSYLSPDGNELATVPAVLGLAHSPGYPLYTWLGKLFSFLPFGDIAHRMNLMSAILGACSVGGLYLIGISLLHSDSGPSILRRTAAALAALLFAFSPTFWSQAVIAEVYSPNIFMIDVSLLLLLSWERSGRNLDFFLFSLAFGLSLDTHISNLGFAPAMALFIVLTDRSKLKQPAWWLAGLGGFALGALQFIWLPLRASTLNDRFMLARAPITLKGLYGYTLGAFPQFIFAFSIPELPDRLVLYFAYLVRELSLCGLIVGLLGLAVLLFRRSRHFYLLTGMYLVHIFFFIQYRVFDLEVFFLPAHFFWALFIAFGTAEALGGLSAAVRLLKRDRLTRVANLILCITTIALAIFPLLFHWKISDHSQDVAVNDFYANVWEMLPEGAVLLTSSGVFGYDAFYWQLAYDTRPDVLLPALTTPDPAGMDLAGRDIFTTTPVLNRPQRRGPGALPAGIIDADWWQIPILFGAQTEGGARARSHLILYALSAEPPELVITNAKPSIPLEADLNGLRILGADLSPITLESGARIHIVLYWQLYQPDLKRVITFIDDQPLEVHELGLGNLQRYHREIGLDSDQVIVEDYWLVIPSTITPGTHKLSIRSDKSQTEIDLGEITIVDQLEMMERWLNIAGR